MFSRSMLTVGSSNSPALSSGGSDLVSDASSCSPSSSDSDFDNQPGVSATTERDSTLAYTSHPYKIGETVVVRWKGVPFNAQIVGYSKANPNQPYRVRYLMKHGKLQRKIYTVGDTTITGVVDASTCVRREPRASRSGRRSQTSQPESTRAKLLREAKGRRFSKPVRHSRKLAWNNTSDSDSDDCPWDSQKLTSATATQSPASPTNSGRRTKAGNVLKNRSQRYPRRSLRSQTPEDSCHSPRSLASPLSSANRLRLSSTSLASGMSTSAGRPCQNLGILAEMTAMSTPAHHLMLLASPKQNPSPKRTASDLTDDSNPGELENLAKRQRLDTRSDTEQSSLPSNITMMDIPDGSPSASSAALPCPAPTDLCSMEQRVSQLEELLREQRQLTSQTAGELAATRLELIAIGQKCTSMEKRISSLTGNHHSGVKSPCNTVNDDV